MNKEVFKKWYFWVIIILVLLLILSLYIILINKKVDKSDLLEVEVLQYLEDKGYTFDVEDYTYIYTTHYIILRNDEEGILIQKIVNDITGTHLSFNNKQINDEFADITSESANTTIEEKEQYQAYLYWLEDMGLTKIQITNTLDFYDNLKKIDT